MPSSITRPARGDLERHLRVLFDQQDREAFGAKIDDQFEQPFDQKRRQAERRLVEHHQLGPGEQCAADGQHLLLAAGQNRGRHLPARGEVREAVVDGFDVARDIEFGAAIGAHLQVFVHGQADHDLAPFRHQNEIALQALAAATAG